MHRCDNPSCVNPKHLTLGTKTENHRDMMQKNRHRARHGSTHPVAKITESDVNEILRLLSTGLLQREVASHFNISKETVSGIKRGIAWKHVERILA